MTAEVVRVGKKQKPKAIFIARDVAWHDGDIFDYVYGPERIALLGDECELYPAAITRENWAEHAAALARAEVVFSTWGLWCPDADELDAMPNLRAVFFAGGSSDAVAGPFLERGISFSGAVEANAIPVAEFCLAQILLSCKGAYRNAALCRQGPWSHSSMPVGPGNYGETVALLGIGAVSRYLLQLLQPFDLRVIAVSDYLTPQAALEMGIDQLVDFETAFREAIVVSNHLPNWPELRGIYTREHFASMRPGAAFINTGRGAQVDEGGLIKVLRERPDLTALLDVQHPEPPEPGSPLYSLPNVHLTSHIAGSFNDEVRRMADWMIAEFRRWKSGLPLEYQVKLSGHQPVDQSSLIL